MLWLALISCTTTSSPEPREAVRFPLEGALTDEVSSTAVLSWSGPAGTALVELTAPGFSRRLGPFEVSEQASLTIPWLPLGKSVTVEALVSHGGGLDRSEPLSLVVPPPPADAPVFELEMSDPRSEAATGLVWLNTFETGGKRSHVVVLDGNQPVFSAADRGEPFRIERVRPSMDGTSVLWAEKDRNREIEEAFLVRQPLAGAAQEMELPSMHHDFVELSDGVAWLAHLYEFREELEAEVATDAVRHIREETGLKGVFSFFDDYPREPWFVCEHAEVGGFLPDAAEWTHSNSLVPHPDGEHYLVMVRHFDAILKVHRATGEVVWQLGGEDSDFVFDPPEAAFHHAHFSTAYDDKLLIFDNADHTEDISRVMELTLDEDERVASLSWSYNDPEGKRLPFLGDAIRLPGGNTLISWGPRGRISEVTPSGEQVWSVVTDRVVGRVSFTPR